MCRRKPIVRTQFSYVISTHSWITSPIYYVPTTSRRFPCVRRLRHDLWYGFARNAHFLYYLSFDSMLRSLRWLFSIFDRKSGQIYWIDWTTNASGDSKSCEYAKQTIKRQLKILHCAECEFHKLSVWNPKQNRLVLRFPTSYIHIVCVTTFVCSSIRWLKWLMTDGKMSMVSDEVLRTYQKYSHRNTYNRAKSDHRKHVILLPQVLRDFYYSIRFVLFFFSFLINTLQRSTSFTLLIAPHRATLIALHE